MVPPDRTLLAACLVVPVCLQLYFGLTRNSLLQTANQAWSISLITKELALAPPYLPLVAVLFRSNVDNSGKVGSNWLCWASRLNMQVHQVDGLLSPHNRSILLSALRAQLAAGYFVAIATERFVFLANPFDDLSRSRPECDVFMSIQDRKGLLAVAKPTQAGALFAEAYLNCTLPDLGRGISCLDTTLAALQNITGTACRLSRSVVVPLREVRPTFEHRGVYPSVVTFEQNDSSSAVARKLRAANLWLLSNAAHLDPNSSSCKLDVETEKHVQQQATSRLAKRTSTFLTVRVLTMDRPAPLRRLISSLSRVEYHNDRVDLEVFVDYPNTKKLPWLQNMTAYKETLELAQSWSWPNGRKRLRINSAPQGLARQWLRHANNATTDTRHSMLMVLEDDLELSPHFYSWLRDVTSSVIMNCSRGPDSDPQLFGIALERQHQAVGLGKRYHWLDSKPWLLDSMVGHASIYLSQQGSSWAPVFFVGHWNSFVSWSRVSRKSGSACVPGLISNTWHATNNSDLWTPWLIKFMFNKGLYMMYFNYVSIFNVSAPPALVVNHREYGAHFFKNNSLGARPGEFLVDRRLRADTIELQSPSTTMPVYDFFMRPTADRAGLRERWRLLSGVIPESCIFLS